MLYVAIVVTAVVFYLAWKSKPNDPPFYGG